MDSNGRSRGSAWRHAVRWLTASVLALWLPAAWSAPFSAVMFEDAPAVDPQTLLPAYRPMLGAPISDELTYRLRDALAALYEQHGFLPPAPRLLRTHPEAGILILEMREPHVASVRLRDGPAASPALAALVGELKALRPLSRAGFDAWVARANAAGFPVQGSLVRLEAGSSAYVASLQTVERRWHGLVHVDNRGPSQLGHEIVQVSLGYRWPVETLGHLRLDVAAAADHERLRYVGLSGGHRLRERGERLLWSVAASTSTLPIVDTSRSVDYERGRVKVGVEVPLLRRVRQRSDLTVTLGSYDLDQWLDDGRRLRRDRIRSITVDYGHLIAGDGGRRHAIEATLHQGLEGLGVSLSPPGADQSFTVLSGGYGYSRRLDTDWLLKADLHLQVSADQVPSAERFFLGGRRLGGAFDPATLSGDQGAGARVAIDRTLRLAGREAVGFAYYDHGYVRSHDDARPADDAGSAGLGLRGTLSRLHWSVEVAVPVVSPETPSLLEDDVRAFFSLTQRF